MHTARRAIVGVILALGLVACGAASTSGELELEPDPSSPRRTSPETPAPAVVVSKADVAEAGVDATADAAAAPPAACRLDTRTVYTQNGRKIESITAYGRYWSRELLADGSAIEGGGFPRATGSEPKFAAGPCSGSTACRLDSRVVYLDGPTKVESITAQGWYYVWGFDAVGNTVPSPGFPQPLTQTPAFLYGPCAAAGSSACVFDTRTIEIWSAGKFETITAYGKWFAFKVQPDLTRSPQVDNGRALDTIERFARGACLGQPAGRCVLDTRTAYAAADGTRVEEVTARDRLWVHTLAADGSLATIVVDGVPLVAVPRFKGPCTP